MKAFNFVGVDGLEPPTPPAYKPECLQPLINNSSFQIFYLVNNINKKAFK